MSESEAAASLREFFGRLVAFKVPNWAPSSDDPQVRNEVPTDMRNADVVSSLLKYTADSATGGKHMVVLDIDHPAWLVKSSTPGHFHLYIDVPGGIEWDKYKNMMAAMTDAEVIETGFYQASVNRGHSDLRFPWIKKMMGTVSQ